MWFFLCTFADSFKQIKAKRTSRIMAKHKIWNTDSAAKEVANLWGGIEGEQLTMMKTHIQAEALQEIYGILSSGLYLFCMFISILYLILIIDRKSVV